MRYALGMVEVYGYLAAVVALDTALKAANVHTQSVSLVTGGLVAVLVGGDVGAVKAAIDSASAAAESVGRIVSVHVIPRPDETVYAMLNVPTPEPDKKSPEPKEPKQPISEEDPSLAEHAEHSETEQLNKLSLAALRKLALSLGIKKTSCGDVKKSRKDVLIKAIKDKRRQEE